MGFLLLIFLRIQCTFSFHIHKVIIITHQNLPKIFKKGKKKKERNILRKIAYQSGAQRNRGYTQPRTIWGGLIYKGFDSRDHVSWDKSQATVLLPPRWEGMKRERGYQNPEGNFYIEQTSLEKVEASLKADNQLEATSSINDGEYLPLTSLIPIPLISYQVPF